MLILYVGRLAREKKLERLAAALHEVHGVRAALVGDGPDRLRLEKLCEGLPVTFTGPLHGAELAAAYASADIFAFPSDTDTFGNVVLEAMACGLPVVATTVGGQVDLVDEDVTGYCVAPDDIASFAGRLARYRDDPRLRAAHGVAGVRAARERTWQRQVELLIAHYRATVGSPPTVAVASAA